MSKSDDVKNWRQRTKLRLLESMGNKCCICGYDKCPRVMHFHHINPQEKEFGIGGAQVNHLSWEKLVNEIRKCVLVCANCHGEIHEGLICVPENATKFNEDFCDYKYLIQKNKIKSCYKKTVIGIDTCPICGKDKKSNRNYCSVDCSRLSSRKVKRPTKEELQELINNNSWLSIGRMFGVSDNAIRKWARSYNLI